MASIVGAPLWLVGAGAAVAAFPLWWFGADPQGVFLYLYLGLFLWILCAALTVVGDRWPRLSTLLLVLAVMFLVAVAWLSTLPVASRRRANSLAAAPWIGTCVRGEAPWMRAF